MANQLIKKPNQGDLKMAANKFAEYFVGDVIAANNGIGIELTETGRLCGQNMILSLVSQHGENVVRNMDKSHLIQILQFVSINELDINSNQVFVDVRKDKQGNIVSMKATPQGSAYEIMVRKFGVGVKRLHNPWIIHEGDEFTMPQFVGLEITPATFKPTLKGLNGKAIAVCYPLETDDGKVEYLIADRESVKPNLVAQILQNLLRNYNAPLSREKVMDMTDNMTFEEILDCKELEPYINPTYKSPASREAMIITKMKANACRHYTKDLGNRFLAERFSKLGELEDAMDTEVVMDSSESKPEAIEDFEVVDGNEAKPTNQEPKEEVKEERPMEQVEESKATNEGVVDDFDMEGF